MTTENGDGGMFDCFRSVATTHQIPGGMVVIFSCGHSIPALPGWKYRLGELHICHRCSVEMAKVRHDRHREER